MRCRDMDVRTVMRELNLTGLIAQEDAERAAWPRWKKVFKVVC
jgi:yeast amino acid transporter